MRDKNAVTEMKHVGCQVPFESCTQFQSPGLSAFFPCRSLENVVQRIENQDQCSKAVGDTKGLRLYI
jgi:hypothetical protein